MGETPMADETTAHDERKRRCPMLGHEIRFAYCRAPGSALPCRKIFDCWWRTFEVESFVRSHFSGEDIEKILAARPDKMLTLVELIEKAKKAGKDPE